jgi:hypothetical protein
MGSLPTSEELSGGSGELSGSSGELSGELPEGGRELAASCPASFKEVPRTSPPHAKAPAVAAPATRARIEARDLLVMK